MKNFYQVVIKGKNGEEIVKEVSVLGDHLDIAKKKALELINDYNNPTYTTDDIISVTKTREEEWELGNPNYD